MSETRAHESHRSTWQYVSEWGREREAKKAQFLSDSKTIIR